MKNDDIMIGLREPFMSINHPEMRQDFAADAKEGGAHDQIWYPSEWREFFTAAGFDLKLRVHLRDVSRYLDGGWGPNIPLLRRVMRRVPSDWCAQLLYPYVTMDQARLPSTRCMLN